MTLKEAYKKIWNSLEIKRRYQLIALLFLMIFGGFLEMASLGAVLPFMSVILDPEQIMNHEKFIFFHEIGGFQHWNATDVVFYFTILFVCTVLLSGIYRAFMLWVNMRISHSIGIDFESKAFDLAVCQNYEYHLRKNSNILTADILKTGAIISVILATLGALQSIFVLLFIVLTLALVDIRITFSIFIVFGLFYFIVILISSNKLSKNGKKIAAYSRSQFKIMNEGIFGIRDLILDNKQKYFSEHYKNIVTVIKRASGTNLIIGQSPRIFIEPLAILVIASVASYFAMNGNFANYLPTFAAMALAAQRILPSVQQLYAAWSNIHSSSPLLKDVYEILDMKLPIQDEVDVEPTYMKNKLSFKQVTYRYPESDKNSLANVSFQIDKGKTIGIAGRTGSGKSTILDMILGLLKPTSGSIELDGQPFDHDLCRAWQAGISHVPQEVFLIDTTIAKNIAFGQPQEEIDYDRMKICAEKAQLMDLIDSETKGFETIVGERGKQLSGGQKQRIGIARALYKQATVLILDEATSALDHETEAHVINELNHHYSDLTLVLVTHRLSTLKNCDEIYVIEAGQIVAKGIYTDLIHDDRIQLDV